MIKELLGCILLIAASRSLITKNNSTDSFPIISTISFKQQQIFYISRDERVFGFINKTTGIQTSRHQLQTNESILQKDETQLKIGSGRYVLQYMLHLKQAFKTSYLENKNALIYQGIKSFSHGRYIFANDKFVYDQAKKGNSNQQIKNIQLQSQQGQKIRQLQSKGNALIIFSTTQSKICFTVMQNPTSKNKKCLNKLDSVNPKLVVSGNFFYLLYQNKTQILNENYELVQILNALVQQIQGSLSSIPGFKSYDAQERKFIDNKLVFQSGVAPHTTLHFQNNQYVLKQPPNQSEKAQKQNQNSNKVLAKISQLNEQPVGLWLNLANVMQGNIKARYELLIQLQNGSLKLYEIKELQGSQTTVQMKWAQ